MALTPSQQELKNTDELPEHSCQNCNFLYSGHYCPRCGQRYMEGRFKFKESAEWVFAQIFNLDAGFFYTIWQLILRPGEITKDYLNKATRRYVHPFRFAFIVASLSAILTLLSGAFESTDLSQFSTDKTEEGIQRMEEVFDFVKKYLSLIMLAVIPFYAMVAKWFYAKRKLNYTEHLIVACYAYSFSLIISWPLILLVLLPNGLFINGLISFPATIIAMAWVYNKTFKENFLISVLKLLALNIIAGIIAMLFATLIGVAFALVSKTFQ